MSAIEERLSVKTAIGGLARYENDQYFREPGTTAPGNPWFIGTLWLAEHHIACAKQVEDLEPARKILEWCAARALPSGVLPEQLHPLTGDPLSVSPLTWSHAAFVMAAQRYARKMNELRSGIAQRRARSGEAI